MNKKIYIALAVALVIVGAIVLVLILRSSEDSKNSNTGSPQTSQTASNKMPETIAQAKATKKGTLPQCLAENAQLSVTAKDRSAIEMGAASQLIDVPAGTHTDVTVATYDGSKASGSETYDGDYGAYNFTAEKDPSVPASSEFTWKVTSFTACKS
jgi:hypothetical protein